MKYKVGDKVRIKNLEWYKNAVKDKDGCVECKLCYLFFPEMSKYCGDVMTIEYLNPEYDPQSYAFAEDDGWSWTDEMIEGLVEPAPVMVNLNKVEKYLRENIIHYVWATNLDQREEWFNNFLKTMEG